MQDLQDVNRMTMQTQTSIHRSTSMVARLGKGEVRGYGASLLSS